MSVRRRFTTTVAALAMFVVIAVIALPFATAFAVKLAIMRTARQQGLAVAIQEIHAPLLRPVVLSGCKIESADHQTVVLEFARAELDLRLAAWLGQSRARLLRNLTIEGLRGALRKPTTDWRVLEPIIADSFSISAPALTVANDAATFGFQELTVSASEIEAGTFRVARLTVASPLFEKTFSNLRGATSWQLERLTIGGITLLGGFDVQIVSVDLSRLADNRIGIDADVDPFGGKLRLSMSAENRGDGERFWNIVASGTEVSLDRMSDAFAFPNRASGSVHALKFTFGGSFMHLRDATASLWTEITGATWRDRTADTLMLGASFYNSQMQVQQLYLKQHHNELTVSGEIDLPRAARERPDFRGDISARIGEVSDFARLFGGSPSHFAGELQLDASTTEREHHLGGQLKIAAENLRLFGTMIDALDLHCTFQDNVATIDTATLRAASRSAELTGKVTFGHGRQMTLNLDCSPPFAAAPTANCISTVSFEPMLTAPSSAAFHHIDATGGLAQRDWEITLLGADPNAARALQFCATSAETGDALVLAFQ